MIFLIPKIYLKVDGDTLFNSRVNPIRFLLFFFFFFFKLKASLDSNKFLIKKSSSFYRHIYLCRSSSSFPLSFSQTIVHPLSDIQFNLARVENWPNFRSNLFHHYFNEEEEERWKRKVWNRSLSLSLSPREMTENGRIESTNRRVERVRVRFEVHRSSATIGSANSR